MEKNPAALDSLSLFFLTSFAVPHTKAVRRPCTNTTFHCHYLNGFKLIKKLSPLIKKRQVFSCEFCEISKSTFFIEHLWTTASIRWAKWYQNTSIFIATVDWIHNFSQSIWYSIKLDFIKPFLFFYFVYVYDCIFLFVFPFFFHYYFVKWLFSSFTFIYPYFINLQKSWSPNWQLNQSSVILI